MEKQRLTRQIEFILTVDRLKTVNRRTYLTDTSRFENSAEHSWHIALMALVLAEHSNTPDVNMLRVIKMLLIHDLVEIDAGDTFAYDRKARQDKQQREQAAADRIFNLLPPDQASHFRGLWDEFEARQTPEACFASALDRLQPLLHNLYTRGKSWQEHGVKKDQVVDLNRHMADGASALWDFADAWIEKAVEQGDLAE
ncbi:MAG: HD domain-containing protein [Desulfobacterales bacterium]|nr:HD domain-containing protein [Desulfobacterales bacterium]